MTTPDSRTAPWTFVLDEPLRILVVDDDPILREFASVYLATPTAVIETACDGVTARTLLGQVAYDLVLLDIEMPHLDGFDLLQEIRSDEALRHLPVIMLTGRDDIASIDRAYQLGADSFAAKPVNWRLLSYQILYVLRTKRAACPLADSHDSVSGSAPAQAAIEHDVQDFLQSVIHRANALERQLSDDDRARFSGQIQSVRSFVQHALAECSGSIRNFTADCAQRADVDGPCDTAAAADRALADRKSCNVVGIQF